MSHNDYVDNEVRRVLRPSSKWTIVTIVAVLILVGAVAFAAYEMGHVSAESAQVAAKTPDPSLTDTPFLAHTKQAGLHACSNVYPILGQLLTNGAKYSVVSEWNHQNPDQHPIQALVGLDYQSQSYSGPAGGIVMASPHGTDCEGAMIRVAPFPTACAKVPSMLPKGSELTNTLGQVAVYKLAGKAGQALLVPSGDSCVVVSIAWARD